MLHTYTQTQGHKQYLATQEAYPMDLVIPDTIKKSKFNVIYSIIHNNM